MSDKVIIDGVDVSECEHFDDSDCLNPALTVLSCESETNCLYKQLQRLKAENKELKEELKQLHNGRTTEEIYTLFGKPIKCWLEYKQALEEIREIANEQKESCKIEGNCIDDRLCSTCFLGSGIELADNILDKINEVLK